MLLESERGVGVLRVGGGMPTNNNGCADVISPHRAYGQLLNTGHSRRLVAIR